VTYFQKEVQRNLCSSDSRRPARVTNQKAVGDSLPMVQNF
jgi:hypothetical protein